MERELSITLDSKDDCSYELDWYLTCIESKESSI